MRKRDFDKVTTKTLKLNKIQVNEEPINEFINSANEVTNIANLCIKFVSDTISVGATSNELQKPSDSKK